MLVESRNPDAAEISYHDDPAAVRTRFEALGGELAGPFRVVLHGRDPQGSDRLLATWRHPDFPRGVRSAAARDP